jgi:uncharacterized protein YcfL
MKLRMLLAAAAVLAATACAMVPETPEKYAKVTRFRDDNVYVARIEEARADDGTLKLAVYGGATVTYDQKVEYRANWYDENDFPIKTSVSNWNQIALDGDGVFEFQLVAPGPRAKRYVIEFQTH